MAICEECHERETGSFTDRTKLKNYVCERCRDTKLRCPCCDSWVKVRRKSKYGSMFEEIKEDE